MKVARRLGTAPRDREAGCNDCTNCPDVFELEDGDFVLVGELVAERNGSALVSIPREVLLAAARDVGVQ